MLGFSPVSSRAISGSPFSLVQVTASLVGAASIVFTATARIGVIVHPRGQASITFGASVEMIVLQTLAGSASIVFAGSAILRVAGKPIILRAVPASYDIRANLERFGVKAIPQSFETRGAR